MVNERKKSLIQLYYESHHISGNRLRQSFLEKERGSMFSDWIGGNKSIVRMV